jgi:hypothetical protein
MKLHIILAIIAFVATVSAQSLAPLTEAHQYATTALTTQRDAELTRLRQPYLTALATADQTATKTGNAEMLRAIEQEREAVNTGKLRADMSKILPRKLFPVRRALITAESKTHSEFDKKQKSLDASYLQKLGTLQSKATGNAILTEQIAREKARVVSGISGAITDLKSGLSGTKWRRFEGEGFEVLSFGKDGKVNGNWNYEIIGRDKVKVVWDKSSAMELRLGKDGSSLVAGDKIWVLDR